MPYIDPKQREELDPYIDQIVGLIRLNTLAGLQQEKNLDGVVNYTVSRIVCGAFGQKGWRYNLIARVVGCLECVKAEFYRRLAGPYEDKAIAKNGDLGEYT